VASWLQPFWVHEGKTEGRKGGGGFREAFWWLAGCVLGSRGIVFLRQNMNWCPGCFVYDTIDAQEINLR
jgi:hypothetical protein